MPVTSRNAQEFLERAGLEDMRLAHRPRLVVDALKVHAVRLERPWPAQQVLEEYEGDPPQDRGAAKPWPNQTEEYPLEG